MRSDMQKVLRDCYRRGGNVSEKGRAPRDIEELPQREGMRRPYNWWNSRKEAGWYMTPLYRYLDKQVGRRWDDVYREIRQAFTAQTDANHDVLRRIESHVETRGLFVRDGVVLIHSAYGAPYTPNDLYVHPETNILCRPEGPLRRRWRWPKHENLDVRVLSHSLELRRIEGIWYEVRVAPVTPPLEERFVTTDAAGAKTERRRIIKESICRDVVTGTLYEGWALQNMPRGATYATSKRQLSHAELKRHGLLDA